MRIAPRIHSELGSIRVVSSRAANSKRTRIHSPLFSPWGSYSLATSFPTLRFAFIRAAHSRDHEALLQRIPQRTPGLLHSLVAMRSHAGSLTTEGIVGPTFAHIGSGVTKATQIRPSYPPRDRTIYLDRATSRLTRRMCQARIEREHC
jgi:hypothetical protein